MNSLVIAIVVSLAAVQAIPYGGYGSSGYGRGNEFGNSAFNRGNQGYLNQGYGSQGIREGHNIGHYENDYDAAVHHHQAEGHNIGGISAGSQGGHLNSGYGGFENGQNNFGRGYQNGYNNFGI